MARTLKQGLDYFPLDTKLDEKFELLEAKYGLIGYGVFIKLLQRIYANSYYLEWNDEKLLLFKKAINVDINTINDIINDCFRWHLLDENLYKKYSILTSRGIQIRYIEASQRRKEIELISEYLLIENIQKKIGGKINVNIYSINEDINSQKKRKEKKREEKRENACARTRKEEFSLSQSKFHSAFPEKDIDADLHEGQEIDLLIDAINESEFLKSCNNLPLSWCVKNFNQIVSGKYKSFKPSKELESFRQKRKYTQEEFQSLFDSLENIEI